jgi:predicted HTH domain antitoxin
LRTLEIELPDSIEPSDARVALALALFGSGKLTLGQAARTAGYSKAVFMEIAGQHSVPVFDYPADDLRREIDGTW